MTRRSPRRSGPIIIGTGAANQALAPQGPALSLRNARFDHTLPGNLRIVGTWITTRRSRTACLAILPAVSWRRTPPCIVVEQAAWLWAPPPMGDMDEQLSMSRQFLTAMGRNPDSQTEIHAMISAIQSRIGDLLSLGLTPRELQRQHLIGDVTGTIRDSDGVTIDIGREIYDD